MEQTLVFVKPDGVQRGLIGEIISRLEKRGLRLVAAKFMQPTEEFAGQHYAIHKGKPFYDKLIEYLGGQQRCGCCPPNHGSHPSYRSGPRLHPP